jgi:hypothetical protein
MIENITKQLAEAVGAHVAAGFSFEALGYIDGEKVLKHTSNGPINIGPDDRRGNYFYIRQTDGVLRFENTARGACKNEYNAAADLRLVMQSNCIHPDKMKTAAASALATAAPVGSDAVKFNRVNIREVGNGTNIAEAATVAKCHLIYVDFTIRVLLDLRKCKNNGVC